MDVAPAVLLINLLRDHLGLTGTKSSCEMQVCGTCTALVDGLPISTCTYLAIDIDGREVLTVEGLTNDGRIHPVQQAFIEESGMQCGFCTPGFIMSTVALLNNNPSPTREDIINSLDGNLCRCTGYEAIIKAVHRGAVLARNEIDDPINLTRP